MKFNREFALNDSKINFSNCAKGHCLANVDYVKVTASMNQVEIKMFARYSNEIHGFEFRIT